MYQAKEFIKLISKQQSVGPKKFRLASGKLKSSRIIHLYQQDFNEEEVAKLLYTKSGKDQNFRKLKSRMLEKASESILFQIDTIKLRNTYDTNFIKVQKLLVIANLLLLKDQRKTATLFLKKAFRLASDIEFTPYLIQIAHFLRQSSALKCETKSLTYFNNVIKKQLIVYEKEIEIESDYYTLLPYLTLKAEYEVEVMKGIKTLFEKIQGILKETISYKLLLFRFRIGVYYYHSLHDFHKLNTLCQSAIQYFNHNPQLFQNARIGEFSLYEMDSCLRMKSYKRGNECAKRCVKFLIPYTSTWSVFYEYYFLLAMQTLNFKKADEIFNLINNSNYKLNQMLPWQKDKWRIFGAYVYFSLNDYTLLKQFNLYKYLNDIPKLSKDKKGYNFIIIISKFLLLLNMKNYDGLLKMEDAFKVYFRRYIKQAESPRHHLFGKFILLLYKNNFILTNDNATDYILKLESYSFLEETEVIPYEKLVKLVIDRCKILNT